MTKDEASSQLRKAIEDHAKAFGLYKDDELLDHYGVIAAWVRVEDNGKTYYTTHFHTEKVPMHVAAGLFHTAEFLVTNEEDD